MKTEEKLNTECGILFVPSWMQMFQKPSARVLYLGAASGTTVSHVSDLVGLTGVVYAVEFSHRSGRDLVNMAKKRTNIIPIIEDDWHPTKYQILIGMAGVIFSNVAQPDRQQVMNIRIPLQDIMGDIITEFLVSVAIFYYGGWRFSRSAEAVFAQEVKKLQAEQFKPIEQVTLEPIEHDHACVVGYYRVAKKQKTIA